MLSTQFHVTHRTATAREVLPKFGLAYLVDDQETTWAVTRSTPGVGLESLQPGQRVDLTVENHGSFSVVSTYASLD